jgi:predicted ATPase/class 3 adenylate cyclase
VHKQFSVTAFLFTDIEGSTRLWEEEPERMRSALARHDELARGAVEGNHGQIVKTTGDGIHAVFADPLDAVCAALSFQQALHMPDATDGLPLAVRCGIHAGVAESRDRDFFGSAVNRAARIMAAAHGGQILVSQTTADLAGERLPRDVTLRDLGLVRLRDLAQPERVYQVAHPSLRQDFPALRSLESTPNNLPQQVTSFVGREREAVELASLCRRARLVTVVGMGGLGKTRLSVQVAANIIDDFPDGVWLVELAAIADPRRVPQAVASVLGVSEVAGQPLIDALCAHVRQRRLLIVLDNCEHLIEASAQLARQLLQAGAGPKILATSREPLRIAGETTYALPPLALSGDVPAPASTMRSDAARSFIAQAEAASDAVRLFIERAQAVQPEFVVTAANAGAVTTICRRLDGIPLALELAAARVRALPVDAIAARLDDRFRLLTGGDRTSLPRQRTLRALIDWSHELLTADEAALFRRLAVFAGGFTLEAAEAVGIGADVDASDVLDTLTHLVEKSLVEREPAQERYRLLETVRQYAHERLDVAGETAEARTRHLAFFAGFAQQARPELVGAHQSEWLARLDVERDNLLAACAWSCEADLAERHGLQLVSALRRYWIFRGLLGLGYRTTREALACKSAQAPSELRCDALLGAGQVGAFMGRYAEAQQDLEQCLAIARELDDPVRISAALQPLGLALLGRGESTAARRHLEEGLALAEKIGTPREVAGALNALAHTARTEGDFAAADPLYERVLDIARKAGDADIIAVSLLNLALVATARGAHDRAQSQLLEVLGIATGSGLRPAAQSLLEVAAGLASARGDWELAARLFGAAEAKTAETGLHLDPADAALLAPFIARAREHLGEAAFAAANQAGRDLGDDAALAELRRWLTREAK